jgi:hypothetical protein
LCGRFVGETGEGERNHDNVASAHSKSHRVLSREFFAKAILLEQGTEFLPSPGYCREWLGRQYRTISAAGFDCANGQLVWRRPAGVDEKEKPRPSTRCAGAKSYGSMRHADGAAARVRDDPPRAVANVEKAAVSTGWSRAPLTAPASSQGRRSFRRLLDTVSGRGDDVEQP